MAYEEIDRAQESDFVRNHKTTPEGRRKIIQARTSAYIEDSRMAKRPEDIKNLVETILIPLGEKIEEIATAKPITTSDVSLLNMFYTPYADQNEHPFQSLGLGIETLLKQVGIVQAREVIRGYTSYYLEAFRAHVISRGGKRLGETTARRSNLTVGHDRSTNPFK